jgi:hypothetical protein
MFVEVPAGKSGVDLRSRGIKSIEVQDRAEFDPAVQTLRSIKRRR